MTAPAYARPGRPLLVGALAAAAFVLLLALTSGGWGPLARLDHEVVVDLHRWEPAHPGTVDLAEALATLLAPWVFRGLVLLVALGCLVRGRTRAAVVALVVIAAGGVAESLLKHAVGRHRPTFADPVVTLSDPSFPSGHALTALLGAGLLVLLARPLLGARGQVVGWGAVVLVSAAAGVDRLVLGVHYPSDVVAGWLLATVLLVAAAALLGGTDR